MVVHVKRGRLGRFLWGIISSCVVRSGAANERLLVCTAALSTLDENQMYPSGLPGTIPPGCPAHHPEARLLAVMGAVTPARTRVCWGDWLVMGRSTACLPAHLHSTDLECVSLQSWWGRLAGPQCSSCAWRVWLRSLAGPGTPLLRWGLGTLQPGTGRWDGTDL